VIGIVKKVYAGAAFRSAAEAELFSAGIWGCGGKGRHLSPFIPRILCVEEESV
jgi:hypothetical protein